MEYSATKLFYDRGWHGINIEPSIEWAARLQEARPRDINLQIAVSDQAGKIEFSELITEGLGPMSSCRPEVVEELKKRGMSFRTYLVQSRPLASVCHDHAASDIHFLKIDVEGGEQQVLAGADFKSFRPWIVAIEAHDIATGEEVFAWEPILTTAGYRYGMSHQLNRFYWAEEHPELQTALSAPFHEYETRESRDVVRNLTRSLEESVENAQRLTLRNEELTRSLNDLEGKNQGVEAEKRSLQEERDHLLRSTSWRITHPLRVASKLIGR